MGGSPGVADQVDDPKIDSGCFSEEIRVGGQLGGIEYHAPPGHLGDRGVEAAKRATAPAKDADLEGGRSACARRGPRADAATDRHAAATPPRPPAAVARRARPLPREPPSRGDTRAPALRNRRGAFDEPPLPEVAHLAAAKTPSTSPRTLASTVLPLRPVPRCTGSSSPDRLSPTWPRRNLPPRSDRTPRRVSSSRAMAQWTTELAHHHALVGIPDRRQPYAQPAGRPASAPSADDSEGEQQRHGEAIAVNLTVSRASRARPTFCTETVLELWSAAISDSTSLSSWRRGR